MESGKLKEADTHKEMYFRVAALTCNAQMHKNKILHFPVLCTVYTHSVYF